MNRFDEIAQEIGWIKPYEEVPLWYGCIDGRCTGKFSIGDQYEGPFVLSKNRERFLSNLTPEIVSGYMNCFSGNSFKEESKDWVVPMLAADYFYHTHKSSNRPLEMKYAKMGIRANPELGPEHFSQYQREELKLWKENGMKDKMDNDELEKKIRM